MTGKFTIFACLALLAGTPACAEEWYYVTDSDEVIDYIDATSITRDGDTATYDAFLSYRYGSDEDGQTWYSLIKLQINCTDHRFRTLSEKSLDQNADYLRDAEFSPDWFDSNDRMDYHAGFVCDGMYRDAPVDDPAFDGDMTWLEREDGQSDDSGSSAGDSQ